MKSANYVPGVSGWKINALTGEFELADGDRVIKGKDPHCQVTMRLPIRSKEDRAKPFIVVGGVTYINQALVDGATVSITEEASARAAADEALASRVGGVLTAVHRDDDGDQALADALKSWKSGDAMKTGRVDSMFVVKMQVNAQGQYVVAGAGLGPAGAKPDLADAIKSGDADAILSAISSSISESELSSDLLAEIAKISAPDLEGISKVLEKLSLGILATKGEGDAARIRTEQRLEAIESAVSLLKLQ